MAKQKYICECCGKEYYSYKANSNYCSMECKRADNDRYIACEFCGKKIKVTKAREQKYKNGEIKHIYCSKKCTDQAHTTKVKKFCKHCGKEFYIGKCFENIQKFCSFECYNLYKREHSTLRIKTCPICNSKFETYHDSQIYCCRTCRDISRQNRIDCICDFCGKKFERIKSEVDKNNRHYCSVKCKIADIAWCDEDIKILLDNYGKVQLKEIKSLLKDTRSLKGISKTAMTLTEPFRKRWPNDEEQILVKNYSSLPFSDVMELLPGRSVTAILGKARTLNLISHFYLNNVYSKEEVQFLKENYLDMANSELSSILNRSENGIEQKLRSLSLFRPKDETVSGYKGVSEYIRSKLSLWVKDVRAESGYTCALTGEHSNLVIHHCHGFNLLLEEAKALINFPEYDSLSKYTRDELDNLFDVFFEIQEGYHVYVCITEWVHKLFHKIYGYGENTKEQWDEFVVDFKNNKYSKS